MPTPEEVQAIKEFIDGQTDADTAAKRCTSRISLEETNPDPTFVWSLLQSLAVEFPDTQARICSEKTFSDLAFFRAEFYDFFTGLKFADSARHDSMGRIKWARVNALSARLTTNLFQDCRKYALETIEDALDEDTLKDSHAREFFLPAAANQIIFTSCPLWNLRNDPQAQERMDATFEWNRWKKAFEGLAENAEVSTETRTILHQAVGAMEMIAQDPERHNWQAKLVEYQASLRASRES
ncbi:MAG: hypothetical protein Q9184_005079 [Pyrenodesmia sp. 2 TL-2023]